MPLFWRVRVLLFAWLMVYEKALAKDIDPTVSLALSVTVELAVMLLPNVTELPTALGMPLGFQLPANAQTPPPVRAQTEAVLPPVIVRSITPPLSVKA